MVFGYSLEDDQIMDLRAAGIQVFQHGLGPAVFAAIAGQSSDGPSDGLCDEARRRLSLAMLVVAQLFVA